MNAVVNYAERVGRNITVGRGLASEMSISELARRTRVQHHRVLEWERGEHKPSDAKLELIAQAVGQTVGWFYEDHEA